MRAEAMEVNQALELGLSKPWAMVRTLSQVTLGPAPESVELEELLEARFFDAGEEIRLYRGETGLKAVSLSEEGDAVLERSYSFLSPGNAMFGRTVTISQVLDFDEDGQAYVAGTRLTGWEGGEA